jgi:predicted membrane protein (TIGR00267 family)
VTSGPLSSAGRWLHGMFDTLSHYHEVAEVGGIMRRYFVMNAFDGVLTTLGVLVGAFVGNVHAARTVVSLILTTAVSIGVAGFYGSYLVERAERGRAMRELEESTLSSLEDTTISSASTYATIVIALVDGFSPLLAALVAMLPFFFTAVLSVHTAYFISGAIAFVELFALGAFLGRLSRERLIWSGAKLALAGLVALGLSLALGSGVHR